MSVLQTLLGDVAHSLRGLLRRPAVPTLTVLVLALGIGASTTVFSILDQVFYRFPEGVRAPKQLRRLYAIPADPARSQVRSAFTVPEYTDAADAVSSSFEIAAYLRRDGTAFRFREIEGDLNAAWVSASFFTLIDAPFVSGRAFHKEEVKLGEPHHVVVVSFDFWRRVLGQDPLALGKPLVVAGKPHTIIGITAEGFGGVDAASTEAWIPLPAFDGFSTGANLWYADRGLRALSIILRVPPETSEDVLASRMGGALHSGNAAASFGDTTSRMRLGSIIVSRGPAKLREPEMVLAALGGVSLLFMVIAGANATNLLLAQSLRRRRETALRLALGITRGRLVQQLVIEASIIALMAAVAALSLSNWLGALLRRLVFHDVRLFGDVVNGRVLIFAFGLALLSALVAALAQSFQSLRERIGGVLASGREAGGPHEPWTRGLLLTTQASLSVLLVIGAALLLRSLQEISQINLGYDVDRLLTIRARVASPPVPLGSLVEILEGMALVEGVAVSAVTPLQEQLVTRTFNEAGDSITPSDAIAEYMVVSSNYFDVAGLNAVRGRGFVRSDLLGAAPVTVVSAAFANAAWPSKEALGECLRIGRAGAPCYTVVGVVEDATAGTIIEPPRMTFYVTLEQQPESIPPRNLLVRTRSEAATALSNVQSALQRAGGSRESYEVALPSRRLAAQYRPWRVSAQLVAAVGSLSLVLAALGLFGVLSQNVSARRRELAIRVSLGASPSGVLGSVLGDGIRRVLVGVIIGTTAAAAFGHIVSSRLYGVSQFDPPAFALAITTVLLVSVAAAVPPAMRAARVDPVSALKSD